jgi:hypothetical protein
MMSGLEERQLPDFGVGDQPLVAPAVALLDQRQPSPDPPVKIRDR